MKKTILFFSSMMVLSGFSFGQQVYDDFDGMSVQFLGPVNGVIDIKAKNPRPSDINSSKDCAKYTRPKGIPYGSIKMNTKNKLVDVSPYATYIGVPPKIKMKVYTKAPIGTRVEVQFGRKGETYPTGVHSAYQTNTTVQNAWEELTFNFAEIPKGSTTAATEIDQIILMFSPNSSNNDVYYFDDVTGPDLSTVAAAPEKKPAKKITK